MGGRAIAERRLAAIKPLLDEPLRTRAMAQAVAAAQGVHVATIYEWLRTYERAGHLTALMPPTRTWVPPSAGWSARTNSPASWTFQGSAAAPLDGRS